MDAMPQRRSVNSPRLCGISSTEVLFARFSHILGSNRPRFYANFLINSLRCTLAAEPEKSPSPEPVNPPNRKISCESSGPASSSSGQDSDPVAPTVNHSINRSSPPPLEELDSRPSSPEDLDSPQVLEEVSVKNSTKLLT